MKKLILAFFALVPIASANEVKIAVIDFARIQEEYYRTAVERDTFEANREERLARIATRSEQLKNLIEEQRKIAAAIEDPTLSAAKRAELETEGRELFLQSRSLQLEIQESEASANSELSKTANSVQRSLTTEIYEKIGEVAESKGFDLVLNRTFGINGVPTVAYSSNQLVDFSDDVIAALNADAPAAAEASNEAR